MEHEHEVVEELEAKVKKLQNLCDFLVDSMKSSLIRAEEIKGSWGGYPGAWAYLDGTMKSHIDSIEYIASKTRLP